MCGVAAVLSIDGDSARDAQRVAGALTAMCHRGPDADATVSPGPGILMGHARLAIIDLAPSANQPMVSPSGRTTGVINGEIYNFRELRAQLDGVPFRTQSDTEVFLAAWERWGTAGLHRMSGMFAAVIHDNVSNEVVAIRDRFGVKPLLWARTQTGIALASEVSGIRAMGIGRDDDAATWSRYFVHGIHDDGPATFWRGIQRVPAGGLLRWRVGHVSTEQWYDLAERTAEEDRSSDDVALERFIELLDRTARLRLVSDVPVGLALSGGLDSQLLLLAIDRVTGGGAPLQALTFVTGDPMYDELPWVAEAVRDSGHPLHPVKLDVSQTGQIAEALYLAQQEPYGGIPTVAYSLLFRRARDLGLKVILDGNGLDEQLGGYDYYRTGTTGPRVQGAVGSATDPSVLDPIFRDLSGLAPSSPESLRERQIDDILRRKLPRSLRFNDGASMMASVELREPFLDDELVEFSLRQPRHRKIGATDGKVLARRAAARLLPRERWNNPKRPVQTPQREWLRGPLAGWVDGLIDQVLAERGEWFDADAVRAAWRRYRNEESDSSYQVWQWVSLGMRLRVVR